MRKQQKKYNLKSILIIVIIFAFIVGVIIGVSQVLDFNVGSEDKNSSEITYEDVTNNVSYYENASVSVENNSSDSGDYVDDNLKVYNESYFINNSN